jgi:hypothetical protein
MPAFHNLTDMKKINQTIDSYTVLLTGQLATLIGRDMPQFNFVGFELPASVSGLIS